MKESSPANKEQIYSILLVLVLVALIFSSKLEWHQKKTFSSDLSAHAWEYIEALSSIPVGSLSTEQKLLLLHSHYVVQNYEEVIRISQQMAEELKHLPWQRYRAFDSMIQDAYRKANFKTGT